EPTDGPEAGDDERHDDCERGFHGITRLHRRRSPPGMDSGDAADRQAALQAGTGSGGGEMLCRKLRRPRDVEGLEAELALAVEGQLKDAGEGPVAGGRDPVTQGDVPPGAIAGDPSQPHRLEGVLVDPEG